jgi:hypothetical protein
MLKFLSTFPENCRRLLGDNFQKVAGLGGAQGFTLLLNFLGYKVLALALGSGKEAAKAAPD